MCTLEFVKGTMPSDGAYVFKIIGRVEERSADATKVVRGNVMLYEVALPIEMPVTWLAVTVRVGLMSLQLLL